MKVRANALSLSGYRLPTEAEWELACRAGSVTGFSMGAATDLLGKYAWYAVNSASQSHPVGSLRPNDLGLFDMHGNAQEWCQDGQAERFSAVQDQSEIEVGSNGARAVRGSSFPDIPYQVTSGFYYPIAPHLAGWNVGIRVARAFR